MGQKGKKQRALFAMKENPFSVYQTPILVRCMKDAKDGIIMRFMIDGMDSRKTKAIEENQYRPRINKDNL